MKKKVVAISFIVVLLVFFLVIEKKQTIDYTMNFLLSKNLIKKDRKTWIYCECSNEDEIFIKSFMSANELNYEMIKEFWGPQGYWKANKGVAKGERMRTNLVRLKIDGYFFRNVSYSVQTSPSHGKVGDILYFDMGIFSKLLNHNEKRTR